MLPPLHWLIALFLAGAMAAVLVAPRLDRMEPGRVARGYLIAVTALMGVRALAYVAGNVFGAQEVRPFSTGPHDLTNVMIGALYGLALARGRNEGWKAFFAMPDLVLALRVATGVGFVLAGLVNVFLPDLGVHFFVHAGYTRTFRLFIMTAEVLGGAALLLPWRWLTLIAAAGLTIDMFGAIHTQARVGEPVAALGAALAMLLRLAPLTMLALTGMERRSFLVALGASVCALAAVVGGRLVRHST